MYIKLLDNYWPLVAIGLGSQNVTFFKFSIKARLYLKKSLQKLHSIFVEHLLFYLLNLQGKIDTLLCSTQENNITFYRKINGDSKKIFQKNLIVKKKTSHNILLSCYRCFFELKSKLFSIIFLQFFFTFIHNSYNNKF